MRIKIESIDISQSKRAMEEWLSNYPSLPSVNKEYTEIRKYIEKLYDQVRKEAEEKDRSRRDYYIDCHMGLGLYKYFWSLEGFNMRHFCDDGFWRYLSLFVAPHIVAERWGKDNEAHYWKKNVRIWFRSICWYVHLSWQGSCEETQEVIDKPCFTTDTILNLEERTGRYGTYIGVYRSIMYYYSHISRKVLSDFNNNTSAHSDDLFRIVMRLNTARTMVEEPDLYLGGAKEYAKSLFSDAGVNIS